ncbi:MAG: ATP-binding protein [Lachnospiraceae bacterium]|nr:ATP-binding protein [Lachnospiraceae bacterium]
MDSNQSIIAKIHSLLVSFATKHLYTDTTEIKDKCFLFVLNLHIIGSLLIIPAMLLVGHYTLGIMYLFIGASLIIEVFLISKFKKNIEFFEKITCVGCELIVAPVFFLSGGLAGGGLFFFLTVVVFSYLVLRGTFRKANLVFSSLLMIFTVYLSVKRPDLCTVNGTTVSTEVSAFANTISCISCIFILIAIFSYQLFLYDLQAKQLEKAKQEAEQANVAKSMFLANMSHEIRTPMGVVIGLSEMIQHEDNIHAVHDMASNVNRTAGMLLNVINDILDFEKISKGKMDIVDTEYFTEEIITDFRTVGAGRAEAKGLKYTVSASESVPEVLFGDEIRLRQVGTNIINNAIKYTESGSIDVLVDYDNVREMLIIKVTDTGKGIKAEDLPFIFDSFQRVDVKNNRHIEGTGLGLSITKRLTEAMGGKVSVTSEYGSGSTFIAEVSHKKVENPTISKNKGQTKEYHFNDVKVLYVDDTKINTIVFNGLLKGSGIDATYAFSGLEALNIVKEKAFDIIFLDYFMPGMDGMETFKKLRENGTTCPIIVITADAVNDAQKRFLDFGFDNYLSKPVQRNDLLNMIEGYTK